mmetsp:Transcript_9371/g.20668  ORF Transcript_9371/g.20668 Transcript_9371/m.20668 type:complete len:385 (+) Transcript_9371:536-1690(+)
MPWSIRQAIIQLWCCARATSASPAGGSASGSDVGPILLAGTSRRRTLAAKFGPEQIPICIEYEADSPDADEFDRVFESRNLEALAALLSSEDSLTAFLEPKHPWAEDPRSVGALAAVFIALLASVAASSDPEYKVSILAAGAQAPLISFLKSREADKVEAAVVALNYLTDECPENARALFEAEGLPLLIEQLDAPLPGLRGAAASTLRHICIEDERYGRAFVELGGIKGFVNLLEPVSESQFDPQRSMLEAVWNLEDVLTDPDGQLVEQFARCALEAGAKSRLEKLLSVKDEEVSSAAEKVLVVLTSLDVPSSSSSSSAPKPTAAAMATSSSPTAAGVGAAATTTTATTATATATTTTATTAPSSGCGRERREGDRVSLVVVAQ